MVQTQNGQMRVVIDVQQGILVNNDDVQHTMNALHSTYTVCAGCHGYKPDGPEKGRDGEQSVLAGKEIQLGFIDSDTS